MKNLKLAATLLTLALSLGASQGALADHDPRCVSDLKNLHTIIDLTDSFSSKGQPGRDKTRLLDKVTEAQKKLTEHRPADSRKKVRNVGAKVTELRDASKNKIDDDDANDILKKVADADDCLTSII